MRLYKRSLKPSRYSQYLAIWEELKIKEKLTLTLHKSQLHCVQNGIQKVKSEQQLTRYRLGLPAFGMMRGTVKDSKDCEGFIELTLTLAYNGESL